MNTIKKGRLTGIALAGSLLLAACGVSTAPELLPAAQAPALVKEAPFVTPHDAALELEQAKLEALGDLREERARAAETARKAKLAEEWKAEEARVKAEVQAALEAAEAKEAAARKAAEEKAAREAKAAKEAAARAAEVDRLGMEAANKVLEDHRKAEAAREAAAKRTSQASATKTPTPQATAPQAPAKSTPAPAPQPKQAVTPPQVTPKPAPAPQPTPQPAPAPAPAPRPTPTPPPVHEPLPKMTSVHLADPQIPNGFLQRDIDKCKSWVNMYGWAPTFDQMTPENNLGVMAIAHNFCLGEAIYPLVVGDTVTVTGWSAGTYRVKEVHKHVASDHSVGYGYGTIALRTCEPGTRGGDNRVVVLVRA